MCLQVGRPIGKFQLVDDLLFKMLGNITSSQALCLRLSQLQDEGLMGDEHASLAKGVCTVRMREIVVGRANCSEPTAPCLTNTLVASSRMQRRSTRMKELAR